MEILKYIFSAHPDKAPLRIMITDNQDGVGGAVADVLREQFSITHDLRIFFTRCAEELTRAARQYSFDFFVLNLEMICFPSKHNFNLSQEYRKTMSLRLIRYLHQRYGIPALVLYCWRGPKFQAVIKNERFAFAIPCSVNALKKAVDCCIKEVVMQNQREQSNRTDPPESHSILIVDDDRDVLKVCRSYFEGGRFTVFTAKSSEEALSFLEEHTVDIVLTDVFMAGMDGLELTRLVKKMTDSDVIVMTGATNVVSSKEARAAGASIFFPKPVRLAKLLEGANLLIEKRKNKS